ncbi:MerR family transcriptional regulator [Planctobacterium marinum]|uniref:MerR family transcriptional regulator n=1 Tax=Planctobacterium marinum TaxID=1631968 RepID=UPI001E289B9E|nr:MerR family transcriptional regulator [Planctobacterium marinum]MCC2607243.1 MerR family transcriptional regulator [Planctobacterium marinum]
MRSEQLAEIANVGKDTLRYYEKIGLLTPPPRGANGYRRYSKENLNELKFIKLAQSVGFTLNEIKPAIAFVNNPQPGCPRLRQAIEDKLTEIELRIEELNQSKAKLRRWMEYHLE